MPELDTSTVVRLQNDSLARLLHQALHARISAFCDAHTPEVPGDIVATAWLNRLFANDSSLYIIVRLSSTYDIIAHAVIDVQDTFGFTVLSVHQMQGDTKSKAALDIGMEYIDKLAAEVNARYTVFYTGRSTKAFEHKYGYKTVRTVLLKQHGE